MFEHLGPKHHSFFISRKATVDWRGHGLLLGLALISAGVLMSAGRAPLVEAGYSLPLVTVQADRADEVIAAGNPRSEVFRFILTTDRLDIQLEQLRFYVNGLYQADIFSDLKLYHHGSQLGYVEKFDQDGNIYFSFDGYTLDRGINDFNLVLSAGSYLLAGQVLQFNLVDRSSLKLSYQGLVFSASADYPLVGGLVSVIDKGRAAAYKSSADPWLLSPQDFPATLGSFKLVSQGELVDLSQLVFSYQENKNGQLSGHTFYLWRDKKSLASSAAQDGQIIFTLSRPIVLGPDNLVDWSLQGDALPVGKYQFSLSSGQGRGFISGQTIDLNQPLVLSLVEVKPYYLSFSDLSSPNNLHDGWNQIFETQIQARADQTLALKRLTWDLVGQGITWKSLELWVDDKVYLSGLWADDRLRMDFAEPLLINDSVNIKLLAKVKNLLSPARIQTFLLGDQQDKVEEASDNILWSGGGNLYNGYGLPGLPLSPHVLTN